MDTYFERPDTRQGSVVRAVIMASLGLLDPKEQVVMRMRYGLDDGEPRTLEEIGRYFKAGPCALLCTPCTITMSAHLTDIMASLGLLDPKEQVVMRMRYGLDDGEPRTLEEIGRYFKAGPCALQSWPARLHIMHVRHGSACHHGLPAAVRSRGAGGHAHALWP